MPMTPLPSPPQTSDPNNFSTKADALIAALPGFVTEANTLEANVVAKEASAVAAQVAAAASATSAATAAGAAVWASGSYNAGAVAYSPSNFQTYRARTTGNKPTDPADDSVNWAPLTVVATGPVFLPAVSLVGGGAGATVQINGIPVNAKRVIVCIDGYSVSGTIVPRLRIGAGGVLKDSGYVGAAWSHNLNGGGATLTTSTSPSTGLQLMDISYSAAASYIGTFTLTNIGGNKWAMEGRLFSSASGSGGADGVATLTGALDCVGLTLAGWGDSFDAGTLSVAYEI